MENLPVLLAPRFSSQRCVRRLWVKLRRAQGEQMSSGLPLTADIAQESRHFAFVPDSDVPKLLRDEEEILVSWKRAAGA
jgi:hypothetical protein